MKPFLVVLSSPSGGGKTSIARRLLEDRDDLGYSVSATTRAIRERERDGIDYHFLTKPEFGPPPRRRRVPRVGPVRRESVWYVARGGRADSLERPERGARHRNRGSAADPSQFPERASPVRDSPFGRGIGRRLVGRNTDAAAAVRERIARAGDELAAVNEYDYVIVNDNLSHAVAQVKAILDAEALRVERQDALPGVVERLRRELVSAADKI